MGYPQENLLGNDYSSTPTLLSKEELTEPATLSRAFECVSEICSAYHYEYFLIATAPDFENQFKVENILLTNLPPHLTGDLVKIERSKDWSVLQEIERTLAPFCWHKGHGSKSDISILDQLFVDHLNTATIHCVQTPTRDHKRAFIATFSCLKNRNIPSEFVLAFLKIFDRIDPLFDDRPSQIGANLTDRELECLRWASVGKTSVEIAVITCLSEHTVNHYLNTCCKKLDCLNRTQAVAKVLRSGVIT